MIKLEFAIAAALYLSLAILALFLYWIFFERAAKFKSTYSAERYIWQCSICTHFYVDSKHSNMSVCPRCGSYNVKKTTGP